MHAHRATLVCVLWRQTLYAFATGHARVGMPCLCERDLSRHPGMFRNAECKETTSFFYAMFKISRSYFPQGVLTRVFAASLGRLAVGVAAFALIFLGAGVARSGGGGGVEG